MNQSHSKFVATALIALITLQVHAEWVKVDDFEAYAPDLLTPQAKEWVIGDEKETGGRVVPDALAAENQALQICRLANAKAGEDVLSHAQALEIPPGKTGTIFLRFLVESGLDYMGSTRGEKPIENIKIKFVVAEENIALAPLMGVMVLGQESAMFGWGRRPPETGSLPVRRNRWYRLWMVLDNRLPSQGGQSKAYLLEEGSADKPLEVPCRLEIKPDRENGTLKCFGVTKSSEKGITDIYLDDVFVDNSGANLGNPMAAGKAIGWKEKLEAERKKYAHLLKKPASWEQAEKQAEELMRAMLPVERFSFVCSDYPLGLQAFPRLGIPNIHFADASCGVVNRLTTIVGVRHPITLAYPCTQLLAATWNLEWAKKYGTALGEECKSGPTHFLLGPGINLQRASWCGRNFEYMGEDPVLAGDMVAEYVRGLQSTGTCATLKHFIGNEIEFHRRGSDSLMDDRTLRELYMEPFRKGIEAGAFSVMNSYNLVNGEWAGQSRLVNTELLRNELGFRGLIMTDWIGTWDGEKLAQSGTDLENASGLALKKSKDKLVGSAEIDRMAKSVLATCIYAGLYDNPGKDAALDKKRPEWEATALEVNREGIVLLKNNGMLPLAEKQTGKKILVLGNYAPVKELSGGGAAHVTGYNLRNYFAALLELFPDAQLTKYPTPQIPVPDEATIRAADAVLIFSGFEKEGEGQDTNFVLPDDELIAKCVALNPRTVVSIVSGCAMRMEWADQAAAIVYLFFGGQTGPEAFGDILTGKVNPSGRLPFTIEKRAEDSPAAALLHPKPDTSRTFPIGYIPDVFKGEFFPSADGVGFHVMNVDYDEGVFIGHRWYESKNIPVRFPFGHGLSYTSFAFEDLKIQKEDNGKVRVGLNVKNTGTRAGAEVVQLYVRDKECSVPRPPQELKAFQKVNLQPGESKQVEFLLGDEAFRFWSPSTRKWTVEPGEFEIRLGASSADIRLQGAFIR